MITRTKTLSFGGGFSGQMRQKLNCLAKMISAMCGGKKGEAFHPNKNIPTVKHGAGSMMLWVGFAKKGTGNIMKENYFQLLKQHLQTSATDLTLGFNWVFQQEYDPKYTPKVKTKWITESKSIEVAITKD